MMKTILAAAEKVDITPFFVNETYLAGFGPNRPADGVADPLSARILYLEDEAGPLVWIAVDLIGLLLPDVDELRRRLPWLRPERLFLASTHTHSGPDTIGLWGPAFKKVPYRSGRSAEYVAWLIGQLAAGVNLAALRKRPARLGFGQDTSDKSEWITNVRQADFFDHTISVMRVDALDGRPIACLTNFACHPELLWDRNTKISPDFVHYLHEVVEKETGARSIFINGALGGMVTGNLPDDTPLGKRRRYYKKFGRALGGLAAKTWAATVTAPVARIVHRSRRDWAPVENRYLQFVVNLGILRRDFHGGLLETSVDFWRIGEAEFVSLPGETLPAVGFAAKNLLPGRINFLFSLGNDELGYLLDDRIMRDPRYFYEKTMSPGPSATRMFLEWIAQMVEEK